MLRGIFPALPTPFTPDGMKIDTAKIKPLCEWLLRSGVQGVFICGTTGEGPCLSSQEKIVVLEETLRCLHGRARVIMQVGCGDLPGTLATAKAAVQMNVDAISLLQPWFFRCDEEAQFTYIARVAEAVGDNPLYLYNLPQNTGNDLKPVTLERLLKRFSNIRGIKESGEEGALQRWLPYKSDQFQIICGNDTQVCRSLQAGGKAIVSSTANVQPKVFLALLAAVQAGDHETAMQCQQQINRYVDLIVHANLIAHLKASLWLLGVDAGSMRLPQRNLEDDEMMALQEGMKAIQLLT
ncbi:MAG: dihydrodipicolinate synthase family protein [bacterium]